MSQDNLNIEKMFREALQHHETPVRADLWATIQSNIGTASAASSAGGGSTLIAKALAVMSIAGAVTATSISEVKYYNSNQTPAEIALEEVKLPVDKKNVEEIRVISDEETNLVDNSSAEEFVNNSAQNNRVIPAISISEKPETIETKETEPLANTIAQSASTTSSSAGSMSTSVSPSPNPIVVSATEPKPAKPTMETHLAQDQEEQEPQKTTAYFTQEIPNVFTPNGDGFNDYFSVDGSGFESFSISVMSRMGAIVFESNTIDFRWDGKDRFGNQVPDGIYFYEIRAFGLDGLPYLEENYKGTITVITTKR